MNSLFFPSAQWEKILALDEKTAKGRAFLLLRSRGWTEGERLAQVCGFDYRTRCSRLRDLGIPVEAEPSAHSPCFLYRIPPAFIDEYEYRRRKSA
jgi:hypothetical protein